MRYSGLIVTGAQGSRVGALVERVCEQTPELAQAKVLVTTEEPEDVLADYEVVTEERLDELNRFGELAALGTQGGRGYGIRTDDLARLIEAGRIPIVASPVELANAVQSRDETWFTVFVDAPDEVLDNRHVPAGNAGLERLRAERHAARRTASRCLYLIQNVDEGSAAELVAGLWEARSTGGVLPKRLIELMLTCGMLLDRATNENVKGASYDLRLGDEYYYKGRMHTLSKKNPILLIEPYDYAIVTSHESSNLPRDVCGRFDLCISLFCQGLVLSNGPQVDPGFEGPLFCLLFNTSSAPVLLKRRQHYATVEFHKLLEPTSAYKGKYQGRDLLHYLPGNAARGAINELKKEVERLQAESRRLQNITWSVLSLVLALIAVVIALRS